MERGLSVSNSLLEEFSVEAQLEMVFSLPKCVERHHIMYTYTTNQKFTKNSTKSATRLFLRVRNGFGRIWNGFEYVRTRRAFFRI